MAKLFSNVESTLFEPPTVHGWSLRRVRTGFLLPLRGWELSRQKLFWKQPWKDENYQAQTILKTSSIIRVALCSAQGRIYEVGGLRPMLELRVKTDDLPSCFLFTVVLIRAATCRKPEQQQKTFSGGSPLLVDGLGPWPLRLPWIQACFSQNVFCNMPDVVWFLRRFDHGYYPKFYLWYTRCE